MDLSTTWDGLPVAPDRPHGAAILVYRWEGAERRWLVLHRAHHGRDYEGDWAWGPPSGARLPGEPVLEGAARELEEEAGLVLPLIEVGLDREWAAFLAEAPADAEVLLSAEHDAYAWLPLEEAVARISPAPVAAGVAADAALLPLILSPNPAGLSEAARLLLEGEVIAFPTDTVYGLAALARDAGAAGHIYEVKHRPHSQQLIAMAADARGFDGLVAVRDWHRVYMERWWPGPLTLVLPALDGEGTLGVRIPDHPVALELLRAVGEPLLTTSANISGRPPAMTAPEAGRLIGVAAVLDGGEAPGGVPSTVASLVGDEPEVLRPGPVGLDELRALRLDRGGRHSSR